MAVTGAGLEGIIAAESSICYIDGQAGILSYQGYNIHTLAENATFEEVVFLLWNGRLPKQAELDELKAALVKYRPIPGPVIDFLKSVPEGQPMHVLRTAVSMLSLYDPEANDMSPESNHRKAQKLMAQTATIVTTFDRLRKKAAGHRRRSETRAGSEFPVHSDRKTAGRCHGEGVRHRSDPPCRSRTERVHVRGRVTAATLSDIYSAVTAAIGALKGPLHGGANEDVIKFLLQVDAKTDAAVQEVRNKLSNKEKIAGFGHRVYRTEDPRATHLRALSEEIGKRTGNVDLYLASKEVETFVKQTKRLNANVDFYSASTYYSLGIPIDLFTPIFAVSRMSGWTAHILEQYKNNRLIRPRAEYTGKPDGQPWVPIEQR